MKIYENEKEVMRGNFRSFRVDSLIGSARDDNRGVEQSGSSSGSISEVRMDTKLKGDIAEQVAIVQALKRGWSVLVPVVEEERRQRKPRSAKYRDAWYLISQWATHGVTRVLKPVKFGEAGGEVIPSQAPNQNKFGSGKV